MPCNEIDGAGRGQDEDGRYDDLVGAGPTQRQCARDRIALAHPLLLAVDVAPRRVDHIIEGRANRDHPLAVSGDQPIELVALGPHPLDIVRKLLLWIDVA